MAHGVDVPQTTLERIRTAVRAVGAGATTPELISTTTGMSHRHAAYALAGARTLALVEEGDGRTRLTNLGKRLADTRPGSADEASVLRAAVDQSSALSALAPGLLANKAPAKATLVRRIVKETGLSEATAKHRAAMLMTWRKRLVQGVLPLDQENGDSGGMWRRVEVRNFRSIASATVNLAPFTVVVGPNGSGKSNFADVLVFARDIVHDADGAIQNRGGITGVRRWNSRRPFDVTIDIRAATSLDGLDSDYVRHRFVIGSGKGGSWKFKEELLEVNSPGRKAHLKRKGSEMSNSEGFDLPNIPESRSVAMLAPLLGMSGKRPRRRQNPSIEALSSVRRYRINTGEMARPQVGSQTPRLNEIGTNIAEALRSLQSTTRFEEALTTMERIVPGLVNIAVEPIGRYLSLKFRQKQRANDFAEFNGAEMSEGALRALGIVVATLQMRPDELLVIEEPEVSIHVGAANLLFDILKTASRRGAVLITTHSAELLDAASGEEILVCEYTDGRTRVGPLSSTQRQVVRDGLFSTAELMRSEPLRIEG